MEKTGVVLDEALFGAALGRITRAEGGVELDEGRASGGEVTEGKGVLMWTDASHLGALFLGGVA